MKQKNIKGFTLIEMLIVVLIIGILAAIALPQYKISVARSRLANILPVFASIKQAQEVYYMLHNEYADYAEDLDIDLSYCDRASDYNEVLICDKYFMIDLLDGGKVGYLRAAYCPSEISASKVFSKCTYTTADYVYNLGYASISYPPFCNYVKTDLGTKICKSFGFPSY